MAKPKRNKGSTPATNDAELRPSAARESGRSDWNRKEVAGLLMVGAGIISGLQASIFSTWVQAKLSERGEEIARIVALTGAVTMVLLAFVWLAGRIAMARPLPPSERPSWFVSSLILLSFLAIILGWTWALRFQ